MKIGFDEALERTLSRISPLEPEVMPLADCVDLAAAQEVLARVDSPSVDCSLKDGYAVRSEDLRSATDNNPVRLKLRGLTAAGKPYEAVMETGTAVRALTGAGLPEGADAIVAEEYAEKEGSEVVFYRQAEPGQDMLSKGSDVARGELVVEKGIRLSPGRIGLLTAAGCDRLSVFPKPKVFLLATGNEVILPGDGLAEGQLYASNLMTLYSWCRRFNMATTLRVVSDNETAIFNRLAGAIENHDAVITSGGAWSGDRDMMARVLERMGWEKAYHRVRLGPGKAAGFGLLGGRPVFILPGGPPSNLVAFLQLALPGLTKLSGLAEPPLKRVRAKLGEAVEGQVDWTQAFFGRFKEENGEVVFYALTKGNRLEHMADAEGMLLVPEGTSRIEAGETRWIQMLT